MENKLRHSLCPWGLSYVMIEHVTNNAPEAANKWFWQIAQSLSNQSAKIPKIVSKFFERGGENAWGQINSINFNDQNQNFWNIFHHKADQL